jgi:outer membrane lipoprotein-sorting protein
MRLSENIEKLIKKLHYETSAETHDRVLGNVLQVLDEKEKQKAGVTKPDLWRTIMNTKTRKFALAAAIIIAAIIGLHYIVGPVGVTGTVYAEVVERLQKARTLIYTVTTTTPVEGMPQMKMEIAFKEPGYVRMTSSGGYISVADWTQGKGLSIIPPRKQFIEMDMANLPDDTAHRQFDAIERLRTLPERADEVLGEREIDGRTVQGFRVNEEGAINTVWIDPKTRELVVVETEFANAPGMGGTMTDFRFNIDLDDSLFSLTPPDGYTRVEVQVDVSEIEENDLIEFLRLWSMWTKNGIFPPTLNPVELAKVGMEMEKNGEFGQGRTSEQERDQHTIQLTRGMMFMMKLPAESNWRYAGKGVKFDGARTPIFWYQPAGSATYRVIYSDLSIEDAAPENLPK